MEEAAQILEIETFIPLLLQVNMYNVSSLGITLKMLPVIDVSTVMGQSS